MAAMAGLYAGHTHALITVRDLLLQTCTAKQCCCVLRATGIHGDIDQAGRMAALADFRAGRMHVLVATDVASRGLDIKSIKTVVSLDAPRDVDTHVHRIGRTGRAGDRDGVAYTLVTPAQAKFAGADMFVAVGALALRQG